METQKAVETEKLGKQRSQEQSAEEGALTGEQNTEGGPFPIVNDQTVQRTASEDPLLKFLVAEWQWIVGTIAVVLLVVFGYRTYETATLESRHSAADLLAGVRADYQNLNQLALELRTEKEPPAKEEKQKKLEEGRARIQERIKALGESVAPYSEMAPLYAALVSLEIGTASSPQGSTSSVNAAAVSAAPWQEQKVGSAQRFVFELQALLGARALLDDAQRRKDAVDGLSRLGSEGEVANVAALATLAAIASTKEERENAKQLIENLLAKAPYYGDALKDARARLE